MRQYLLNIILLFLGFTIIYSCSRHQQINRTIFLADSIMEYQPDSAFKLLKNNKSNRFICFRKRKIRIIISTSTG